MQSRKHFVRKVKEVEFYKMYLFEEVKILAWKLASKVKQKSNVSTKYVKEVTENSKSQSCK